MAKPVSNVIVAPLGRRFGAAVLDRIPVAIISGIWGGLAWWSTGMHTLVYSIACAAALFGWLMLQWWLYSTRKAGFGYKVAKLELVKIADGKAIGWGRMILRSLILNALWVFVIPGIIMVIFLIIHERRQGWHDLAVKSLTVMPKEAQAETVHVASASRRSSGTVGLPDHLVPKSSFSGEYAPEPTTPVVTSAPGSSSWQAPEPPQSSYAAQPQTHAPIQHAPQTPVHHQTHAQQPTAPMAPSGPTPAGYPGVSAQTPEYGQQYQHSQVPTSYQPDPYQHSAQETYQPARNLDQQTGQGGTYQAPAANQPVQQPPSQPVQQTSDQQMFEHQPPQSSAAPQPVTGVPSWGAQPGEHASMGGQPPANPHTAQSATSAPAGPPVRIKPRQAPTEVEDGTRIANPAIAGSVAWQIRMDDGREFTIRAQALVGRNPQPRETDADDVLLIPAGEPASTVSKTHMEIGVDGRGLYVMDRGSTNGTAIRTNTGEYEPCAPDVRVPVRAHQIISFGERQLIIQRVDAG